MINWKKFFDEHFAVKKAVEKYANPVDDPANKEFMEEASAAWEKAWEDEEEELGNNGEPIKQYNEDDPRLDR